MKSEELKKLVNAQWERYQPEAIIANLIAAGGVNVANDFSYLKKFAEKYNMYLSPEELQTSYDSAKEIMRLIKEENAPVNLLSQCIDKPLPQGVNILADDFDVTQYISGLRSSREDYKLSGPTKVFKYDQIMKDTPEGGREEVCSFKMPDETTVVVGINYEFRTNYNNREREEKVISVDLTKLGANGEVLDDDPSTVFFMLASFRHDFNTNQIGVRSFTKEYESEVVSRIDLVDKKDVFVSKQYDFVKDNLNEVTITPDNTKVVHDMKDYDKRYLNNKMYSNTQKRHASTYSQATEFNSEKELTVSFQLQPKNGIMVPMNFKRKEDGSFLISYISTTPDTIYWEYNVTKKSIDITVKEQKYNKNLKHEYNLSRNPDEMELEFFTIGNQLFEQDFRTIEEIINKIPKMISFYDKIESECKGDLNNITQHMKEAEDLFTGLKYMSYSKRIKKENESQTPKI